MNNDYKKIAVLLILMTLAAIIWRERSAGQNRSNTTDNVSQENPFIDIEQVPLKLDSLEIPQPLTENIVNEIPLDPLWGRDPFKAEKD